MFDAYIDNSGILLSRYRESQMLDGYAFVICTSGGCRVNIYNTLCTITTNSVVTLLPNSYFKVLDQAENTTLYVVSFRRSALLSAEFFATILEHITHIIEQPVVEYNDEAIEIIRDYVSILMRIKNKPSVCQNREFVGSLLKQFIIGIGVKYDSSHNNTRQKDQSRALVTRLIKLIITHYKESRSAAFYAERMHVSLQHLSSVVRRVTNRTITDIIALFVIIDAQTKLVSTDMSIGEIAVGLSFDDISVFGRYFKRYTNLSPRQYRNK